MNGITEIRMRKIRCRTPVSYTHLFLPTAKVTIGGSNLRQKTILKVKRALCSVGAFEGIHYSFFSPFDLDQMGFAEDALERKAIRIMNPINEDLSLMRTTLDVYKRQIMYNEDGTFLKPNFFVRPVKMCIRDRYLYGLQANLLSDWQRNGNIL